MLHLKLTVARTPQAVSEGHELCIASGVYPEAWNLYTGRFVWASRTYCRTPSCYQGSSDARSLPYTSIQLGYFVEGNLKSKKKSLLYCVEREFNPLKIIKKLS